MPENFVTFSLVNFVSPSSKTAHDVRDSCPTMTRKGDVLTRLRTAVLSAHCNDGDAVIHSRSRRPLSLRIAFDAFSRVLHHPLSTVMFAHVESITPKRSWARSPAATRLMIRVRKWVPSSLAQILGTPTAAHYATSCPAVKLALNAFAGPVT